MGGKKLLIWGFVTLVLVSLPVSSLTFNYSEGDLVDINPKVKDLDNDNISLNFSDPLNESGMWQTGFEDSGLYNITLFASDGSDVTAESFQLRIEDVNRPPVINVSDMRVEETSVVRPNVRVSDPDGDNVSYEVSEPFDDGVFNTSYEDSGVYNVTVFASDGLLNASDSFVLRVVDKNRAPVIDSFNPEKNEVVINESDSSIFSVRASDPDEDSLSYDWLVDGEVVGDSESFVYQSDYESNGSYDVVVNVSDGEDSVVNEWFLVVNDVNRRPDLSGVKDYYRVDENSSLSLDLPKVDRDGDSLSYSIGYPVGDDKKWSPGFEDSGLYNVSVNASDGELSDSIQVMVNVSDVDRKPVIKDLKKEYNVEEGGRVSIPLEASDPDGDSVTFNVKNLPGNAKKLDDSIVWEPPYSYIQHSTNFFTGLLNRFRLDKWIFSYEKSESIIVEACGKSKCSSENVNVVVEDVNRAPTLEIEDEISVREGEKINLDPRSVDADNDHVKFYFEKPFNDEGVWNTGFEDSGEYDLEVTASDGRTDVTKNINVNVEDVNRAPIINSISDKEIVEGEKVSFRVTGFDPDREDSVSIRGVDLPSGSSFERGVFSWTPSFDTVTNDSYVVENARFNISDDVLESSESFSIVVHDNNRPPVIENVTPSSDIVVEQGTPVLFKASASDPDGDSISYTWDFGWFAPSIEERKVKRVFTSPGYKQVRLVVSDGEDQVVREIDVKVGK